MNYPWYSLVSKSSNLQQGDFIQNMGVPIVKYTTKIAEGLEKPSIKWVISDWVIMTQSCDINPENKKSPQYVLLCPVSSLNNSVKGDKNKWGTIIRNRMPNYHSLKSHEHEISGNEVLLVNFSESVFAKLSVVRSFAINQGERLRLNSPYLEQLSTRYGQYYSRIGYPIDFPKKEDQDSFTAP